MRPVWPTFKGGGIGAGGIAAGGGVNTFTSQQSIQDMMQRLNAYLNMLVKFRLPLIDSDGRSDKDGDGSTVVATCLWEMRHRKATEQSQIQAEQQSMPSNRTDRLPTSPKNAPQRRADLTKTSDNLGDALSAFGESDALVRIRVCFLAPR